MSLATRTGYIAIVGRPNVGKSTLLNHLLGTKLSITSRRPQTTQHQILGVLNDHPAQLIFIDTPGLKREFREGSQALGSYIKKQSIGVLAEVDVAILVVDVKGWTQMDSYVLEQIKQQEIPVICVLNKIDQLEKKELILTRIKEISELHTFDAFIPTSAIQKDGLGALKAELKKLLPEGKHIYEEDDLTDRSSRFLVGEIVREQLFRQLGEELPYQSAVVIDKYDEQDASISIHATIFVEKESQKGIVVGRRGQRLKSIGTEARQGITELVGRKVNLYLRVRTKQNWTSDHNSIVALGYQ
ncbi:MAG: GTPase Era [Gammaproteobacteria bacterium]|nr:GTPase Era [Gammaproteobacteria bacterium]